MLSFWVRREGQEVWEPVPAEGTVLPEDTYTIVARSPQPHFTITVEVRQYPPAQGGDLPVTKATFNTTPIQTQSRSVRTNDEGIGIILPTSYLSPGFWELHCRDADLIAELFGEAETENCLRLQVVPREVGAGSGPPEEMALPLRDEPEPVAFAAAQEHQDKPPTVASSPDSGVALAAELFSLMHTELEGSPNEMLVLTGRIGCSGELRVRVWQAGQDLPIFEGQRLIQFPVEARTAVFSIPITLPSHTWTCPLRGELLLTPNRQDLNPNRLPLRIAFSIRCRGESDTLLVEEASTSRLPLTRLREGAAQAASSGHSSATTTTLLSPERTLQKLLRIWQQSTPELAPVPPAPTEPVASEPERIVSLQPQELPTAPGPQTVPRPDSQSKPMLLDSPGLKPEQSQTPGVEPELPIANAEPVPSAAAASPGESLLPFHPPAICPTPQLLVPEQLRAGDNFDVVLRLSGLGEPPPNGSTHQAPFWIKFWVKHGRTRSLVDGPRWLLDFSYDEQGQWQALTRITIPPGVPELIFEAWAVSPDRQHQSDRVIERRLIQP
ncbi:MAG: hypothetical protein Q6K80_05510 [Thermostichus sp. DG_1_6_bins_120]